MNINQSNTQSEGVLNQTINYEYEYFGKWYILDLESDDVLRTEREYFSVICEYPPNIWNKMEEDNTDEYTDLIQDSYTDDVCIEYEDETEYTDGNEGYWRIENGVTRNLEYLLEQVEIKGYSFQMESTGCPFYSWDEDLNLSTHETEILIYDENNKEDQFCLYIWEILDLDEDEFVCYDEEKPFGYSELGEGGSIINYDLLNKEQIDEHLSKNLKKFRKEILEVV